MASTKQFLTHFPTGGMNQSALAHVTDPENWWELLNLRPVDGGLVQTFPITRHTQHEVLVGEAASPTRLLLLTQNAAGAARYFILTENLARYQTTLVGGTHSLIPCVVQVTIPNNTTITGQALLYGINTTDFAVTGDYITVEIVSSTSFRWRKNTDSWTTLSMALNQPLGANGLQVSFLTTTGFTVGDLWVWQRLASPPYNAGVSKNNPVQHAVYNRDIYIAGYDRTILRLRDDMLSSVGYKKVFGRFVQVFYDHLVVAHFAEATYNAGYPQDPYNINSTPWRIAWSDLRNPDNFFATDLNEADYYTIPSNDSAPDLPSLGCTGMEKWGNQLIIFLSDEMHQMNYVGLPRVMKIDPMNFGIGCAYPGSIVKTPVGLFFWAKENIYKFSGMQVEPVGYPIQAKLYGELNGTSVYTDKRQQTFGFYDKDKQEIVWTYWIWLGSSAYQQRQVIYQLHKNRWYFRNIPSQASGCPGDIRAICRAADSLNQLVYGTTGWLLQDQDYAFNVGPVDNYPDIASLSMTGTYTSPTATTTDFIYGNATDVKEIDCFHVDASYGAETSGVQLSVAARKFTTEAVSFVLTNQLWTPTLVEERLSLPRVCGKVFRYKLNFTGTKPYSCVLNAWGDFVQQTKAEQ